MNRRQILKALAAATAAPVLPAWPAMVAQPAPSMSTAARFWAIYLTRLHGDVTPAMLARMTGIDPDCASAIRAQLIAERVIRPTGFAGQAIAASRTPGNFGKPLRQALKQFETATGPNPDYSESVPRTQDEETLTTQ